MNRPKQADDENALTPIQIEVSRLFFDLPASDGFLLSGGAALLAQHLNSRPTQDLDFFTRTGAGDVFTAAAESRGWTVERYGPASARSAWWAMITATRRLAVLSSFKMI